MNREYDRLAGPCTGVLQVPTIGTWDDALVGSKARLTVASTFEKFLKCIESVAENFDTVEYVQYVPSNFLNNVVF